MADSILLILGFAAAAFLGGMLRSLLSQWLPRYVGTFVANMLASLAAGLAIGFALLADAPFLLPVIATGFAGALSTWSTLASELTELIRAKKYKRLVRYLFFTLAVGLVLAHRGTVWAGRIYHGLGETIIIG